tara:strand:+ start:1015 stop:1473 length:459 start_codon:yes stop_codon:yes gene_type:complete
LNERTFLAALERRKMNEQKQFETLGLSVPILTIVYGVFLILWGAAFSLNSQSMTSWIPAMLGLPILVSGLLAKQIPAKRKLWMHIAVLFGLIAFLGGFRFFAGFGSDAGLFGNVKAASSQLMLLVTGGFYTQACVRSFLWARKHQTPPETTD